MRKLVIFPEHHGLSRRSLAVDYARRAAQTIPSIALFVEGVQPIDRIRAEGQFQFPVQIIEHPLLTKFCHVFALSAVFTRLNGVLWALNNPVHALSAPFLDELNQTTALAMGLSHRYASGRPFLLYTEDQASRIISFVLEDVGHSIVRINNGIIGTEEGMRITTQICEDPFARRGISSLVRQTVNNFLANLSPEDFISLSELLEIIRSDLNERGLHYGDFITFSVSNDLASLAKIHNPARLTMATGRLYVRARFMREAHLIHRIAETEFELGVLSIGAGHIVQGSFVNHLRSIGLELETR
ncbi:hypothetical protein HY988_06845 [Candidatus Micrarchaeota archaeon]|nr:hypothetical protein [Candidatus Micrarchaeota archaeon]